MNCVDFPERERLETATGDQCVTLVAASFTPAASRSTMSARRVTTPSRDSGDRDSGDSILNSMLSRRGTLIIAVNVGFRIPGTAY
jgi:hypothetical protein